MEIFVALAILWKHPWILVVFIGGVIAVAVVDRRRRVAQIRAAEQARLEKEREHKQKQAAYEEMRRRREQEKKRQAAEQRRVAEERRQLREKEISDHKRMVAEQRRLMTDSLRYDILSRDGFRCKICGATSADGIKLHVDHIIPVSKGGKTVPGNLRTLCEHCNLGKRDKIEIVSDSTSNWTLEEALQELTKNDVSYVDNTSRGGCFWIELTPKSTSLLAEKTIAGKQICRASHSKVFSGLPALYIKFDK